MASLLLSSAGSAIGGAVFGPIGAIAGRIVGAVAGSVIDHALFGSSTTRHVEGPRLSDLDVMASTEGAPIPRVYGRVRLAGQVIWATSLEEVVTTRTTGGGGKGGTGGGPTTTTTVYSYFANFAVGLCEGPIGRVARVWADGKLLDLNGINHRVYTGSETQEPDALIVAKEGEAPAYRGLAYVVFERLPLADFGNRIPQLSFEIVRPVGALERMARAVTLIPGTTEFGYEPSEVVQVEGIGTFTPENRHVAHAPADLIASLDDLEAACPNLERVAIVVAWFGSDLRAGSCEIKPGVEVLGKSTHPLTWSAAGLSRATAHLVSTVEGRPAFGSTPSDVSVTHLIAELKARGLKVTLYPFMMMDIPADNDLPDPQTGVAPQPAYPWRGHITCDPAPGRPGSPDGTGTAATQIDMFFGIGDPTGWNYRRLVLHYANLAAGAGGVDAFLIGSELRGLTRVRSSSGVYPAVMRLAELAADVKVILGDETIVTYGADWTEYGAHVVDDMAQEVRFPLDALWASSAIDAVGIDYYAPLADWRGTAGELDRALTETIYEPAYLAGNLRGGEGYDWYYMDGAARAAQTRSPITDGLGKPWTFRAKDLWNRWASSHYERVSGAELPLPTTWTPQGKPIWLTEIGCPAVDKGANQPSTFPDAKSADGGVPYFSNGRRDDLIQRRFLEAALRAIDPAHGATVDDNPVSSVYGGRMIAPDAIHLWTWDARPYPIFPAATDVWSDGPNWETGHWLTGRLGGAPLDALVATILDDAGIGDFDSSALGSADYRRSAATSRRLTGGAARTSYADLAVVTNDASAERRANIWLQDLWAGRESAEFALPPSDLALAVGDVIGLTVSGRRRVLELRAITDTEGRAVRAQSIDPGVFDVPLALPRRRPPDPPPPVGPAHVLVLDLPTLTADEPPILQRLAVFAEPWPGAMAIWRSPDGSSFERAALAVAPSIVGETLDDLPRGPTSRFDHVRRVRVRLLGGTLESVSDAALFAGANAAALQRPDGAWEVIQFANATLVDTDSYELSRLLRGQAGSEWVMGDPLPAGAPFVLLDEHVIAIARGLDALGQTMQLRVIAAGRDHGDPATVALTATPQATALRPLSPVHLRARRTVDGVTFTWIRRTRRDGDSWDAVEVPLGETNEAYDLDVLDGATVKRTLTANTPSVLYAAADEIADFGSAQASLSVRIAQLSATVGRGYAAQSILTP